MVWLINDISNGHRRTSDILRFSCDFYTEWTITVSYFSIKKYQPTQELFNFRFLSKNTQMIVRILFRICRDRSHFVTLNVKVSWAPGIYVLNLFSQLPLVLKLF